MPVPTPETVYNHHLMTACAVIYYLILLLCLAYVVWYTIVTVRDTIRKHRCKKYLKEDAPVEYILDYPGYAIGQYYDEIIDEDKQPL